MSYVQQLAPLTEITLSREDILRIKRNELVPLLQNQHQLNHYADRLVQAEAVLLNGVNAHLIQELSRSIEQLISVLNNSKKIVKPKTFNRMQKWLGLDLDYGSKQIAYYKNLDDLLERTSGLSQKLQIEIQKSQARYQQLLGLREQMANYIFAAKEFLIEYPEFVKNQHPLDHFHERLSQKINSLEVLQSANDLAMTQLYLSQQLAFSLLDRFKEAQQVLIPAWQYHVQQMQQQSSDFRLAQLDASRDTLIRTLKHSLNKPPQF